MGRVFKHACQELSKVIKYISARQEELLAVMDRKRNLMSEALEELRKQIFQESETWTRRSGCRAKDDVESQVFVPSIPPCCVAPFVTNPNG